MNDLKREIQESIQLIDETTNLLYKNNIKVGYEYLEKTLALLSITMKDIYQYQADGNNTNVDEKQINDVLNLAMKAMESNDIVLLSDILHYDLCELLNKTLSALT